MLIATYEKLSEEQKALYLSYFVTTRVIGVLALLAVVIPTGVWLVKLAALVFGMLPWPDMTVAP